MSEVEKLRALLAEARGVLSRGCWSGECCRVRTRIDAALAEPSNAPTLVRVLRKTCEDSYGGVFRVHIPEDEWDALESSYRLLQRERDEAQAEVERLRKRVEEEGSLELALLEETGRALGKREWESVKDAAERAMSERDDAYDSVAWAYQRGAEAMREAAAEAVKHLSHEDGLGMGSQRIESAIRALPVPEDKP